MDQYTYVISLGTTNGAGAFGSHCGVPRACFCSFSRRPAAPFRGDSPRASLRGGLSSLSKSSGNGRFGEFVVLMY